MWDKIGESIAVLIVDSYNDIEKNKGIKKNNEDGLVLTAVRKQNIQRFLS